MQAEDQQVPRAGSAAVYVISLVALAASLVLLSFAAIYSAYHFVFAGNQILRLLLK